MFVRLSSSNINLPRESVPLESVLAPPPQRHAEVESLCAQIAHSRTSLQQHSKFLESSSRMISRALFDILLPIVRCAMRTTTYHPAVRQGNAHGAETQTKIARQCQSLHRALLQNRLYKVEIVSQNSRYFDTGSTSRELLSYLWCIPTQSLERALVHVQLMAYGSSSAFLLRT